MKFKLLLIMMMMTQTDPVSAEVMKYKHNKKIPAAIEKNVLLALAFYPSLKDATIDFIFKPDLKTSVMQAQPVFSTLLNKRSKRKYRVNISEHFSLINAKMPILEVPDDVMIGWIGHELGHIMDYEGMTNMQLVSYGYRYYFHDSFVKHAEMVADSLAVERGMGKYIVATKRFILDHADLPKHYKDKIRRLYLSPDVIVEQVRLLEEKKLQEQQQ
jgi:hypothetical protein